MRDLYKQLADGKPLDTAMTTARLRAYMYDEVFWAIPVLFMGAPDGVDLADGVIPMTDEYLNFNIRIYSCGDKRHLVSADLGYRNPAEGIFPGETMAVLQEVDINELLSGRDLLLSNLVARPEDARGLGEDLWKFLFPPPVKALFDMSKMRVDDMRKQGLRIRIWVYDDTHQLSRVPWEYCRDAKQFMAMNVKTPIVRYVPTDEPPLPISVTPAGKNPGPSWPVRRTRSRSISIEKKPG